MAAPRIIRPSTAIRAINALHEGEGASAKKITKYLQQTLSKGGEITEKDVALALKKAIDKGAVVAKEGKYRTVRAGPHALDGRRRRRSRSRGRRRRSRSRRRTGRSMKGRGQRRRSRSRRRRRSSRSN
ncbi:female-specific protein transformer-like [Hetaerina americana]|uniref:female-specific protein transformer-like n=1 Tax=Hetaerina americana TaxID=62018 RepID=UPI003A7F3773